MNVSVPAVLLGLGWKCLLNWALVFLQRRHIGRSFVGCFSVSLSLIDTALTLLFITIHLHSHDDDDDDEGPPLLLLADLQLTTYHTCLLVQILGQVHSVLQWPVVVLTGLDHFCSVCLLPPSSSSSSSSSWATWIIHSLVTVLLWFLAVLYVFLLSDFSPVMEDVSHQEIHRCWVFHTSEILQVVTLLLLTLGCAALHDVCNAKRLEKDQTSPLDQDQSSRSRAPSSNRRGGVVCQVLCIFLDTWAFLLIFLAVLLLLLPVGIPSYLGLNAAWLCFLNSSLIAVVLCVACPDARLAQQGLAAVPPDSFCEWRFKFSLAAAEKTT